MKNLKRILPFSLILCAFSIYFTSCSENEVIDDVNNLSENNKNLVPKKEIDNFIEQKTKSGDGNFAWEDMPNDMLYSATMLTDSIISVTYVAGSYTDVYDFFSAGETKSHYRSNNKLPNEWLTKRDEVIDEVLNLERKYRKSLELSSEDILPFGRDDVLPHIYLKITNPEIIKQLRKHKSVINVEPALYIPSFLLEQHKSTSFGCYPDAAADPIISGDYSDSEDYTTPWGTQFLAGSKVSWNYPDNGITNAWELPIPNGFAGEGIGICVIDTGVSDMQDNLDSEFTAGLSYGRTFIDRISTVLGGPEDACGHGTGMAGVAAGPLVGDGNAAGVAFRSDLMTVRANYDVLISGPVEIFSLAQAFVYAANNNDVDIISLSMGTPFFLNTDLTYSTLAIAYAALTKQKLIFAAAGTGYQDGPVIYPANLSSNLTVAITGAKNVFDLNGGSISCYRCHSGKGVDFAVIMEYGNGGASVGALTLPMTPDPLDIDRPKYSNGSSCATATAAGIAALVWAAHPNETKEQIYNRLAENAYSSTNRRHGHGILDAAAAIAP